MTTMCTDRQNDSKIFDEGNTERLTEFAITPEYIRLNRYILDLHTLILGQNLKLFFCGDFAFLLRRPRYQQ
jgi:hypothetical protein